MTRRILFVTGARSDAGHLAPLLDAPKQLGDLEIEVFVTGIHTLAVYGNTAMEFLRKGYSGLSIFNNQYFGESQDIVIANTINGLTRAVQDRRPDLIVVHGASPEAMAAALLGALRNVRVAHLLGSEGALHADILPISKLCHAHLVPDEASAQKLCRAGERMDGIFVVGSPDIDALTRNTPLKPALKRYEIPFGTFSLACLNADGPAALMKERAALFVEALQASDRNFVVLYPSNSPGAPAIIDAYETLRKNPRFRVLPSVRWEFFLTLLRHTEVIVGNSGSSLSLAPQCGIPSIFVCDTGSGMASPPASVTAVPWDREILLRTIQHPPVPAPAPPLTATGFHDRLLAVLHGEALWAIPTQKNFVDPPAPDAMDACQIA